MLRLSTKHRKWIRILLILLLIRLVLGGILLYITAYRFNEVLQLVVDRESKGKYSFHAEHLDVSYWHRTISLENAVLKANDTTNTQGHVFLRIPLMYFSLHSLTRLIFNKEVYVDSFSVQSPEIILYSDNRNPDTSIRIRPAQVMDILNRLALHLKVRSLKIEDASFTYQDAAADKPFRSTHIHFYIKNFSKKSGGRNDLLSSEDIDLAIYDQDWQLPGDNHRLSFKKLHFSGANQYFVLDSAVVQWPPANDKAGFLFSADRLFFNSRHLQEVYEKDELNLDTLICYRPVLNILEMPGKTATKQTTSPASLSSFFQKLHFRYIAVNNGQVVISPLQSATASYEARQAGLKIFNLVIHPADSTKIEVDSVQLVLNDLQFLSRDSLFQLSIHSFTVKNKEVVLTGAEYGPTKKNKSGQLLFFRTPELHMHNVNFEDLLQKKLSGGYAELRDPEIHIINQQAPRPTPAHSPARIVNFFKTLHELNELIDVDSFRLVHANLHYDQVVGATHIFMHHLDATILLNRFLQSDSLIDIKRSLPELTVSALHLRSPKAVLLLNNYTFNGSIRQNRADYLQLDLDNHSRLIAKQLYWEIFDWDLLENHRIFQVDNLHIHTVDFRSVKNGTDSTTGTKRNLPVINIGRLDVDSFHFVRDNNHADSIVFDAGAICMDDIHTSGRFFLWGNAGAELAGLKGGNSKSLFSVDRIHFTNEAPVVLKDIQYKTRNGSIQASIPSITSFIRIHTSDLSHFFADSVEIVHPEYRYRKEGERARVQSTASGSPVQFEIKKCLVNDATVQYRAVQEEDSLELQAKADLQIRNLKIGGGGNQRLGYDLAELKVRDFSATRKNLSLNIPGLDFAFSKGSLNIGDNPLFSTSISGYWSDAEFSLQRGDSNLLFIHKLDGAILAPSFHTGSKIDLNYVLENMAVKKGSILYTGRDWTFSLSSFSWKPLDQQLHLADFQFRPRLDKTEYYQQKKWQCDYLEAMGKSIDLYSPVIRVAEKDSSYHIQKMILDGLQLTTSRDKRMPFQHGLIKPMPTALIESLKFRFGVDTVQVTNSQVTVREISVKTAKEGIVEIRDLDANITGMGNREGSDSLTINASASLFGSRISHFRYTEGYADSLSHFSMGFQVYPIVLTRLNTVTMPLAALQVRSGRADTLFTAWKGNTHGAIGNMNFYYDGLRVKILNPKNESRGNLKLFLVNALANTFILRGKNNRESVAFFIRDPEKFVFNYWVKTTLGGIVSSVGMVKDAKYLREYQSNRARYSLPDFNLK